MKASIKNVVITGLLIGIGLILPSIFHMFGAGSVLLPMHLPVLICGFVCGAPFGAACGFILPLLSSGVTGMPPLFPVAPAMALELCAYGAVSGLLFRSARQNIYLSLLGAMLCGRLVSGAANAVLLSLAGKPYGLQAFLMASFVTSLPGILLQIVFVPLIVMALIKMKLVKSPKVTAKT